MQTESRAAAPVLSTVRVRVSAAPQETRGDQGGEPGHVIRRPGQGAGQHVGGDVGRGQKAVRCDGRAGQGAPRHG